MNFRWKNSIHSKGWANVICLSENGDHVCIVTSQLLTSFVLLKLYYYDDDWSDLPASASPYPTDRFELNPLEKIGRMIWKGVSGIILSNSVGKQLVDFALMPQEIGLERKSSRVIGRQISWSWNQATLTEVAAKKVVENRSKATRQMSRQLSGLHSEQSPKAAVNGAARNRVMKAMSRGFSRELSRALSRGNSDDEIFDPSTYQLPPTTENQDPEAVKRARMRGSMVQGIPAKQQYGERLGAKTKGWAAKIFHSKDYDSEKVIKVQKRIEDEDGADEYAEAFGKREEEEEMEREGGAARGKGGSHGNGKERKNSQSKPEGRQHQRKSRTQVVPVDRDEFGSS